MAKGMKRSATEDDDSSFSSSSSSDDDISRHQTSKHKRRRSQARRNTSKKERSYPQGKEIISFLAGFKEEVCKQSKQVTEGMEAMYKQLEKLREEMCQQSKQASESKEEMCKQLEKVKHDINQEMHRQLTEILTDLRKQWDLDTNNGSSGDDYAPRSQSIQVQPPRYRLVFKSGVTDKIEKGKLIDISVALVDGNDQTVENGPLASATVELVVVSAEFNQHNNLYNWSKEDFESNIKKAQGNSATADVDQSAKSIVSGGRFNLVQGFKCHCGSKIFSNSGNKKVRLGVMVVSPTGERVLEGLSDPFYVRGHDRPARQTNLRHDRSNTQRKALDCNGYQEQNCPMPNMQNPSWPFPTQAGGTTRSDTRLQLPFQEDITMHPSRLNINEQLPGNSPMLSAEPSTSQEHRASIQCQHFPHLSMMAQAANNQIDLSPPAFLEHLRNLNYMSNEDGMLFSMDHQRILPVQIQWDRSNVEPSKRRWNLFDKLITPPPEHFGLASTSIQKSALHTRQSSSALIEPLEPDDSDEERPLKSRRQSKYQLRFVNKVCEAYYTRIQIKADEGSFLMVALFDGNNTKITSGPLSSASVEVVALHGDFNANGQDYWTSEEFSRSVVCQPPGEEASSVLGGDRTLVLAGGAACLGDAFFQRTSFCARTGKFKMGVRMLASVQEERIQEGISEPFRVVDRRVDESPGRDGASTHKAMPPGFVFRPTDKELIVDYLWPRGAGICFPGQLIADVDDIYKFDPWDLPAKAAFGEKEWYFFHRTDRNRKYPTSGFRTNRATKSGYWKPAGKDRAITLSAAAHNDKTLGFKKTFVFYSGCPPSGMRTSWVMHEYHLVDDNLFSAKESLASSTSSSSDAWLLCRITNKETDIPDQQLTTPVLDDNCHLQPLPLALQDEQDDVFSNALLTPLSTMPPSASSISDSSCAKRRVSRADAAITNNLMQ